jgi:hypothetical protein
MGDQKGIRLWEFGLLCLSHVYNTTLPRKTSCGTGAGKPGAACASAPPAVGDVQRNLSAPTAPCPSRCQLAVSRACWRIQRHSGSGSRSAWPGREGGGVRNLFSWQRGPCRRDRGGLVAGTHGAPQRLAGCPCPPQPGGGREMTHPDDPSFRVLGVWPLTKGKQGFTLLLYLPPTRHAERPRVGLFFFGRRHAS